MTRRLTTNYAKNYCNRTLIVKVIAENVVTCFLLGHGVYTFHARLACVARAMSDAVYCLLNECLEIQRFLHGKLFTKHCNHVM